MNLLETTDIDYPYTVSITRPGGGIDGSGNYVETFAAVVGNMPADIQLSLRVRDHLSESGTGTTESSVWMMYCVPSAPILEGDRVSDGSRTFTVEAVGEWGSHTECVMRKLD